MRNAPEILAPVGAEDMLTAALRCGADAVYFGIGPLNARRRAEAPDVETLKEWVDSCHIHGAKAYGAMNVLAFDEEFPALENALKEAAAAGVDAILVADLGVARWIKEICPEMPLHASTQMSINSVNGAKELLSLAFSRVVLGRELSYSEMAEICQTVPIETEVFVHGAHCFAVSGQCTMSSFIGGRSGNRGMCAQPCRLPFFEENENGNALSLKDLSLIEHIQELSDIGIHSVKIEGRMKRPEYVAAAVTACVSSRGKKETFPEDFDRLKKVFSRSGFTDGYFKGERSGEMFGTRQKSDVTSAEKVFVPLRALYNKEQPLVPIQMELTMKRDAPISLILSDNENHQVTVEGIVPEEAADSTFSDSARIEKSLSKLGNTPYFIKEDGFQITVEKGVTAPVSAFNVLRRRGIQLMNEARCAGYQKAVRSYAPQLQVLAPASVQKIHARFTEHTPLSPFVLEKADVIVLPVAKALKEQAYLEKYREKIWIEPPRASFGQEKIVSKMIGDCAALGFEHLSVTGLGDLVFAKEYQLIPHGSFSMNLLNSESIDFCRRLGIVDTELSLEMDFSHAAKLKPTIPVGLVAYGKVPVMLSRQCPGKAEGGCKNCSGKREMRDRIGNVFLFQCNSLRSVTEIYNPFPIWLADKPKELSPFSFLSLYFTDESEKEMNAVFSAYTDEKSAKPEKLTRGLSSRAII